MLKWLDATLKLVPIADNLLYAFLSKIVLCVIVFKIVLYVIVFKNSIVLYSFIEK